ncbi:MAG: DUF2061 domain-containing protein [Dehalococcoidia bacterium]|jgi:uncharacterized membrane protein
MNKRAIYKAISWEGISNTAALGLAYLMFGHAVDCIVFTVCVMALKLVGYYWHERFWDKK